MENVARNDYRDTVQKDIYSDDCCMSPSSSFDDKYVKWLESRYESLMISVELLTEKVRKM